MINPIIPVSAQSSNKLASDPPPDRFPNSFSYEFNPKSRLIYLYELKPYPIMGLDFMTRPASVHDLKSAFESVCDAFDIEKNHLDL